MEFHTLAHFSCTNQFHTQANFTYDSTIYKQVFGPSMGSPLAPILASMIMEDLDQRALTIFPNPPSIWVHGSISLMKFMQSSKRSILSPSTSIQDKQLDLVYKKERRFGFSFILGCFFRHQVDYGSFSINGIPRISEDIYLIHLNILPLKSSALPEPSSLKS